MQLRGFIVTMSQNVNCSIHDHQATRTAGSNLQQLKRHAAPPLQGDPRHHKQLGVRTVNGGHAVDHDGCGRSGSSGRGRGGGGGQLGGSGRRRWATAAAGNGIEARIDGTEDQTSVEADGRQGCRCVSTRQRRRLGGAESSRKAVGRNRAARKNRPAIEARLQRCGSEGLPEDAATQRRGTVAHGILHEDRLRDRSTLKSQVGQP